MKKTYRIDIFKAKMNKLVSWILILSFVGVLFTVLRNIQSLSRNKLRILEAQERLEKLEKEHEELEEKERAVQSTEFKEEQIRDKLGLVKEGEIIVVLPDPEIVKKFTPLPDVSEESKTVPNWKKWVELFN